VTMSQSIEPACAWKACDLASYVACLWCGDLPRLIASNSAARTAGGSAATAALRYGAAGARTNAA
jgi:hypothetical protein